MIASRAFSRIPRVWQVGSSHIILISIGQFQRYHYCCSFGYISRQSVPRDIRCLMDWNKKRKTVYSVWRPISMQCDSNQECLSADLMAEPEDIISIGKNEHESHIGGSSTSIIAESAISTSSLQDGIEVVEAAGVVAMATSIDGGTAAEDIVEISTATSSLQSTSGVGNTEPSPSVNKYSISLEIGASVMRFIKGKDGSTQKGIEDDLGVKIIFPSSKKENSIVIEGDSVDALTKASDKVQTIIGEAVKSPAFTYSHFVSLPLAIHPELVDKLFRFQSTILEKTDSKSVDMSVDDDSSEDTRENEDKVQHEEATDVAVKLKVENNNNQVKVALDVPIVSYKPKASKSPTLPVSGIDKSIFIKPKTFHLTVLMLKLWNKERVNAAIEVWQSVLPKVIEVLDNRPLFVRLKGLELMKGSKTKAHILYAPVEEIGNEDRLSLACQVITDAYVKAGLVLEKDACQKLKLHATLMNTSHRRMRNRNARKRSLPFDASDVFEMFGSEHWGDYLIREAHLSQRFVYDDNGYYHCCASIPLPESSPSS